MNKVLKIIFNKNTGHFNVVSEISNNNGKCKSQTSLNNKSSSLFKFKMNKLAMAILSTTLLLNVAEASQINSTQNTINNAPSAAADNPNITMLDSHENNIYQYLANGVFKLENSNNNGINNSTNFNIRNTNSSYFENTVGLTANNVNKTSIYFDKNNETNPDSSLSFFHGKASGIKLNSVTASEIDLSVGDLDNTNTLTENYNINMNLVDGAFIKNSKNIDSNLSTASYIVNSNNIKTNNSNELYIDGSNNIDVFNTNRIKIEDNSHDIKVNYAVLPRYVDVNNSQFNFNENDNIEHASKISSNFSSANSIVRNDNLNIQFSSDNNITNYYTDNYNLNNNVYFSIGSSIYGNKNTLLGSYENYIDDGDSNYIMGQQNYLINTDNNDVLGNKNTINQFVGIPNDLIVNEDDYNKNMEKRDGLAKRYVALTPEADFPIDESDPDYSNLVRYASSYNQVMGSNNNIQESRQNYIIGSNNEVYYSEEANIIGFNNKISNLDSGSLVMGVDNIVMKPSGTGDIYPNLVIGKGNSVYSSGKRNILIGTNNFLYDVDAKDNNASYNVIIGSNATSANNNSIALGHYSVAKTDLTKLGYLINDTAGGEVNISANLGSEIEQETGSYTVITTDAYGYGENGNFYPDFSYDPDTNSFNYKSPITETVITDDLKNRRITGVSGAIRDNDAINIAQLKKVMEQIGTETGEVLNPVLYDSDLKNIVTLGGTTSTTPVHVGNVANATISSTSTDAVNGSVLSHLSTESQRILGGSTTIDNEGKILGPFITNNNKYKDIATAIETESLLGHSTVSNGLNTIVAHDVANNAYTVKNTDILNINSTNFGGTVFDGSGLVLSSGQSITNNGINLNNTKITELKDGEISDLSKESVNGSQIDNINKSYQNIIGGQLTYNNGAFGNEIYMNGTNKYSDLKTAIESEITKGLTTVTGNNNIAVNFDKNLNNYDVALNKDIKVKDIVFGGSKIDNESFSIVNGPTINKNGIDSNNLKIINVADGEISLSSKEAINGRQLYESNKGLASILDKNISTNKTDGSKIDGTVNINDVSYNNYAEAIEAQINNNHITLTTSNNMNHTFNTATNEYQLNTNDDLVLNSVKVNNQNIDSNSFTLMNGIAISNVNGFNLNNHKITNVHDGLVSKDSLEAINGSQLYNNNESLSKIIGGNVQNSNGTVIGQITVNNNKYDTISDAIEGEFKDKTTTSDIYSKISGGKNISSVFDANDYSYTVGTTDNMVANSVNFGDGSILNKDGFILGNGSSITNNGIDLNDTKSTNIGNGIITKNSKDGVAGNQVDDLIKKNIAILGGDLKIEGDKVQGPFVVNKNEYSSISEAIENESKDTGHTTVTKGTNTNVVFDSSIRDFDLSLSKDLKLDSINVADNVLVNDNGIYLKNGIVVSSNKIDGGSLRVQNVDTAVLDSDAINYKQFKDELGKIDLNDKFGSWTFTTNNGEKHNVSSKENLNFQNNDGNLIIKADDSGLSFDLNNTLNVGDTNKIVIDGNTGSITNDKYSLTGKELNIGNVSISKDKVSLGNNKVTNVAGGKIHKGSEEAINGSQVNDVIKESTKVFGKDITYNYTENAFVGDKIGGTSANNISDAIREINNAFNKVDNITSGKNIEVTKKENNTGGFDYVIKNKDDVEFDKVTVHDVSINKDSIDSGNKLLTSVEDGLVEQYSKEAVNTGQIWEAEQKIKDTNFEGTYEVKADDGKSFKGSNIAVTGDKNITTSITENGINVKLNDSVSVKKVNVSKKLEVKNGANIDMGGNTVSNIGDGVVKTDGANLGQVKKIENNIKQRMDDIEGDFNSGIAGAMALESPDYRAGEVSYAVGVGGYKDKQAIAVTVRSTADNGKWSLGGGVTASPNNSKTGFRVGVSGLLY